MLVVRHSFASRRLGNAARPVIVTRGTTGRLGQAELSTSQILRLVPRLRMTCGAESLRPTQTLGTDRGAQTLREDQGYRLGPELGQVRQFSRNSRRQREHRANAGAREAPRPPTGGRASSIERHGRERNGKNQATVSKDPRPLSKGLQSSPSRLQSVSGRWQVKRHGDDRRWCRRLRRSGRPLRQRLSILPDQPDPRLAAERLLAELHQLLRPVAAVLSHSDIHEGQQLQPLVVERLTRPRRPVILRRGSSGW